MEDAVPGGADGWVFGVLASEESVSGSAAVADTAPSAATAGGATMSASGRVGSMMAKEAGFVVVGVGVGVWVVDARPGGAGYGVAVEEGHFV